MANKSRVGPYPDVFVSLNSIDEYGIVIEWIIIQHNWQVDLVIPPLLGLQLEFLPQHRHISFVINRFLIR